MDDFDPLKASVEARVGQLLKGKWRLDALLGVGGMAAVYAATHRNSKRVAVKILHPDIAIDETIRQRFVREGYAANRVGHRGAVDILDDDVTEDGAAFLVMELLEGENLDRRMRRKGGSLSGAEVLSIADQVLDVLGAAHERGILHRDVKPENIFLTRDGVVKLLDFGIARILELGGAAKVTQRGAVLGTPAFMAPEQAMAIWEQVDQRSDLWALGATLFILLTGRLVHPARTDNDAIRLAVSKRARSVGSLGVDVHPAVVRLVDRALEFERSSRFQAAREMQEAVRSAYAELEGGSRMEQLSLPEQEPVATQGVDAWRGGADPVATNPAPDHAANGRRPAAALPTIASQRNVQKRFVRNVAVGLGVFALVSVVVVVLMMRESSRPEASAATLPLSASGATSAAPGAPPRPPASVSRLHELPVGSAKLVVPVIAVSALPPEPTSHSAAPPLAPTASTRPRPPAAASTPAPPHTSATTAKPTEEADPFSGRF